VPRCRTGSRQVAAPFDPRQAIHPVSLPRWSPVFLTHAPFFVTCQNITHPFQDCIPKKCVINDTGRNAMKHRTRGCTMQIGSLMSNRIRQEHRADISVRLQNQGRRAGGGAVLESGPPASTCGNRADPVTVRVVGGPAAIQTP